MDEEAIDRKLTVGDLHLALEGLPNDMPIIVGYDGNWGYYTPSEAGPAPLNKTTYNNRDRGDSLVFFIS